MAGAKRPAPKSYQEREKYHTMRFGSTAKVLAECMLKYYRISEWDSFHKADIAVPESALLQGMGRNPRWWYQKCNNALHYSCVHLAVHECTGHVVQRCQVMRLFGCQ